MLDFSCFQKWRKDRNFYFLQIFIDFKRTSFKSVVDVEESSGSEIFDDGSVELNLHDWFSPVEIINVAFLCIIWDFEAEKSLFSLMGSRRNFLDYCYD